MEEYKLYEDDHPVGDGIQKLYRFPNGYGASVIRFSINVPGVGMVPCSFGAEHGLWELALVKFDGSNFELVYEHGFDDVIGRLTDDEVLEKLNIIKEIEVSHE